MVTAVKTNNRMAKKESLPESLGTEKPAKLRKIRWRIIRS